MARKSTNQTVIFVQDQGNNDIKNLTGSGKKMYVPHALAPLSLSDWNSRTANSSRNPPEGMMLINGNPFAVGDYARRHQIVQPRGAQRYEKRYYGVIAAAMLGLMYEQSAAVSFYGTYAPRDHLYQDDMRAAVEGRWHVHNHKGQFEFDVVQSAFIDEPLGGLNHYNLDDKLTMRRRGSLLNNTVLVVDVGGLTVDIIAVDPGMRIDVSSMTSSEIGVAKVMTTFEQDVRARYKREFRNTTQVDRNRLEYALQHGVFPYGRAELDVQREAAENLKRLLNDVVDIINRFGGVVNYDTFLLTGGGAMLIYEDLQARFPDAHIVLAESNPDDMRYANVLGARKFFQLIGV